MNKQTFIQLIKNPSGISPEQLLELEKVVDGFPYCQSAYILIAKQAVETGSMFVDQKIKKAAAYTLDRKNLKKILYGNNETASFESQKELSPIVKLNELTTVDTYEINNTNNEINPTENLSIVTEEIKSSTKQILTDEERDQVIHELQENLEKLHALKNKVTWNEVPENPILSEKNASKEELTKTSKINEDTSSQLIIIPETKESYNEDSLIITTSASSDINSTLLDTISLNDNNCSIIPIRIEDVVFESIDKELDSAILLEYLDFLEEKRSVFRKNKKKEGAIIDKIILDDPTIPKLDINNLPDNSIDLSSKNSTVLKGAVSENFAKILVLQGKRDKAIEIYEQLILKNPEKKPYFESLIEKLKNKI